MSEQLFQDLHVVVTGGTGALGRGVIDVLLSAGATCHVPSFAASELQDFPWRDHERVQIAQDMDLADEQAVASFYNSLPNLWASIHCAGGFAMAPFADTTSDDLNRLWRMNALSCFLCSREALRNLRRPGRQPLQGGRIVNVAARPSVESRTGASMVAYTMTKSAVAALTQALGEELMDEDILVNAVAPSIIDSPANRQAMADADHSRWPAPRDIAETMVFLASPNNRTTRSAVVPVYGKS